MDQSDSCGEVRIKFNIVNLNAEKDIKYTVVYFNAYNTVRDITNCTISVEYTKAVQIDNWINRKY